MQFRSVIMLDEDDIHALVKGPGLTACTVRTTASPGDRFRGRTFG
jgi:hypothetical protein